MLLALTESPPLLRRWLYRFRPAQAAADLGERGRGLHWLIGEGFPTPPAWALATSTFDLAVNQAGLSAVVAEIEWSLRGLWNDVRAVERVLTALEPQRVDAARRLRGVALGDRLEGIVNTLAQVPTPGWMLCPSCTGQVEDLIPRLFVPPTRRELWDGIRQMWSAVFSREVLRRCAQSDQPLPRLAVVFYPLEPITPQDRSGWVYGEDARSVPDGDEGPAPLRIEVTGGAWEGESLIYLVNRPQTVDDRPQTVDDRPQTTDHSRPSSVVCGLSSVIRRPSSVARDLTGDETLVLADLVQSVAEQWGGPVRVEFLWRAGQETPLLLSVESS